MQESNSGTKIIHCEKCGARNFHRQPPLPLRNYVIFVLLVGIYLIWDKFQPLGKLGFIGFGLPVALFAYLAVRDRLRFNAGGGPLVCKSCKSILS
jgi:hypothetical protein